MVVTLWDIGGPQDFMHDEIATDKRNPTVNANGPLYGADSTQGVALLFINRSQFPGGFDPIGSTTSLLLLLIFS